MHHPAIKANRGDESKLVITEDVVSLIADGPAEKRQRLSKAALKRRKQVLAQHNAALRKTANGAGVGLGPENNMYETSYYFENGLRKVYPYHSAIIIDAAKGRLVGRTLKDGIESQFEHYKMDGLGDAIREGKILVNGTKPTQDYVLKEGDYISQQIHRHENPVLDSPLEILADTEEVLVINKPPSIPVHTCGWYRYNTLPFILQKEMGFSNVHNIYRIDRLASGVLVFGKTEEATRTLKNQVMNKHVQKEYVCRVMGEFPSETLTVDQPLLSLSNRLCLTVVDPRGKPSQTTFTRLSYNGRSSVVKCAIHSGRTHQIRVHLQYLGYPIINDPFYNNSAWGPNKGKGGVYEVPNDIVCARLLQQQRPKYSENPMYSEKLEELQRHQRTDISRRNKKTHKGNFSSSSMRGCDATKKTPSSAKSLSLRRPCLDWTKWHVDPSCDLCRTVHNPKPRDLVMFLHALKYTGPDWEYATEFPDWAREDWEDEDKYMLGEEEEEEEVTLPVISTNSGAWICTIDRRRI